MSIFSLFKKSQDGIMDMSGGASEVKVESKRLPSRIPTERKLKNHGHVSTSKYIDASTCVHEPFTSIREM